MRITEIHVENFRGVQCATLHCGALTALVGRNGAGKSTFLHALDLFYRPNATVTSEDFSHRRTDAPIAIRVTFKDLHPDETEAFRAYVHGNALSVTKRFQPTSQGTAAGGQYFAARRVYARFTSARAQPARKKMNELAELGRLLLTEGLITEVPSFRSEADADTFMAAFEESHQALLELQEDTYQFFGERNVGGGKLDTFTQFVYVPAVRDAQQETGSKGTSFSQLLDLAVFRRVNALPQVAGLLQQLRKIVTETFEPEEVRGSLTTLEKEINAVLQPFVPTASLSLRWSGEPSVTYEAPKILPSLTEDAFSGDISRKGHGLQRALILALLSHLARVRTARTEPGEIAPQSDVPGGPARDLPPAGRRGPDYIIGIEEPELYQHPNRCRHFASVLRHLAAEQAEDGSNTQILFTTHSPYFVSLEHFENVRLVRKDARDTFGLTCTSLSSHTVEEFRVAWADICGRDPKDVTVGSLLARLLRTMTDSVNEGFFADVVVLVEGIGDVGVLTAVAEERKAEWVAQGVTVLAVDGKENLAAPILILRALGIPTYFIFDGDQHLKGKGKSCNEHQAKATNKGLLRLGGVSVGDSFDGFPEETATEAFACFAGRLEDSCRLALGDEAYDRFALLVAEDIGWPVGELLKSGRGGECFVHEVYTAGKTLPNIEKLVERISGFAKAVNAHPPGPIASPALLAP